jgi:hypothetical protein
MQIPAADVHLSYDDPGEVESEDEVDAPPVPDEEPDGEPDPAFD